MMKRERCVLFQWVQEDECPEVGMLIEQLRYAGVITVVRETEGDAGQITYMLELKAPKGVDAQVWAQQNAARMQSFGINAQDTWKEIR